MAIVTGRVAVRPRDYVRVSGPDAQDFLQRMVSNDVASGDVVDALLLTAKARVIAALRIWRRGTDDFLLLTDRGRGEPVQQALLRARFAARVEIAPEEHSALVVFGGEGGIPNADYGEPAVELLDSDADVTVDADELERLRIEAGTPAWGKEIDDRVLPAEAGLVERAVSFTKGCYPGQEPIARLHHRGHVNRRLRVLDVDGEAAPEAEIRHGEKVVGRVTSAVPGLALAYVRVEVPEDADLDVAGVHARMRPA